MSFDINDLNNLHIDVLREIGNIGAGNAATALAEMLGKKVDMDVPKVRIVEFKDVSDILGGAEMIVVGILLNVYGDIKGNILFILQIDAAHVLVNMLLGKPLECKEDFNEIEISALKEIGNILTGSYISALSGLTGLDIKPSVPNMAVDMAGAIISVPAIEFGKIGDNVLYIETEFKEVFNRVIGDFFLIPDIESYEIMLKALGVLG